MRRINIILLSITICFGGIALFFVCVHSYKVKKLEVKEKAREAFGKSFNEELKSRNLGGYFLSNYDAKAKLTYDIPDSVYIDDELGRHWFKLDPEKHHLNITDDINVRSMHSFFFNESPIKPDSLQLIWSEYLKKSNVFINSALYVSVMGKNGIIESNKTSQSEWCTPSNLVFKIYIGYACEIEIVGYLQYSIWRMMWMEILLYSLLYAVSAFLICKIIILIVFKVKSTQQREIIEVPVRELVKEVTNTPIRSYILHENIIFYAEQMRIEKVDGTEKKLQRQTCRLLELFLKAKENEYVLMDTVIMDELWPNGAGTVERLHKAIARLRASIQEIEYTIDIKRNTSSSYQLIL